MSTLLFARVLGLTVLVTSCSARQSTVRSPPTDAPFASTSPPPVASPEPGSADASPTPVRAGPLAPDTIAPVVANGQPLSDEQLAIFLGTAEDAPAEVRAGVTKAQENKHYLAGNEQTLDVYYPLLQGLGGGYVGVGTDQAYLLMSWIRPSLCWLIDYDAAVVEVHELYRLFMAASETADQMVALWDRPAREPALAMIEAAYPPPRAKSLRRWYLGYRGWIHRRLVSVARRMKATRTPSYLTDQEHYDFVRSMLEQRRVRPMIVNLHEESGLKGVAQAARQLEVPIRVLYLSNAEEYWPRYPTQYRENIAMFPFAQPAVIVRTLLTWQLNQDYRYNLQSAADYIEWLQQPYIDNVYDITHAGPTPNSAGINFFETVNSPDDSPAARRWHKAQADPAIAGPG